MQITKKDWNRFINFTNEVDDWATYEELITNYKRSNIEWDEVLNEFEKPGLVSFNIEKEILECLKKINEFIFILKTERLLNDK